MIQRIQSVWFLLAAIACIVFIFTPFAISGSLLLTALNFIALAIMSGLTALLTLGIIFLYKNRKLQITLSRVALVMVSAIVGLGVYFALTTEGQDTPYFGAGFPVLAMAFIILAIRGVQADINLLKSMDRLR